MSSSSPVGDSTQVQRLLIMRHGEAESRAGPDFERRLTPVGRRQVAAVLESMTATRVVFTRIIASPLVRAQETAQILQQGSGTGMDVDTWEQLVPEGECAEVVARLDGMTGTPLLVSHQPLVGRLVEYLTGEQVGFGTASIASVRYEVAARGCGTLEWIAGP